jgi:hypothetical protein
LPPQRAPLGAYLSLAGGLLLALSLLLPWTTDGLGPAPARRLLEVLVALILALALLCFSRRSNLPLLWLLLGATSLAYALSFLSSTSHSRPGGLLSLWAGAGIGLWTCLAAGIVTSLASFGNLPLRRAKTRQRIEQAAFDLPAGPLSMR